MGFYPGSLCYRPRLAIVASLLSPVLIVNLITVIVVAIVEIIVIPFLVVRNRQDWQDSCGAWRVFRVVAVAWE